MSYGREQQSGACPHPLSSTLALPPSCLIQTGPHGERRQHWNCREMGGDGGCFGLPCSASPCPFLLGSWTRVRIFPLFPLVDCHCPNLLPTCGEQLGTGSDCQLEWLGGQQAGGVDNLPFRNPASVAIQKACFSLLLLTKGNTNIQK